MRTKIYILVYIMLAFASATFSANAATFSWPSHDLTFEIPEGGTITYNNGSHLEIMWNDMALIIRLYNKQGADIDAIRQDLYRRANGFNMFETHENKLKVKGFKCQTIDGSMPDRTRALLADLICNDKDLLISVTVNYLLGNIEDAEDIVKSITIGKPKAKKEKKQKIQTEEDAKAQEELQRKGNSEQNSSKNTKVYETYDI